LKSLVSKGRHANERSIPFDSIKMAATQKPELVQRSHRVRVINTTIACTTPVSTAKRVTLLTTQ
jgi:hypothetical protein